MNLTLFLLKLDFRTIFHLVRDDNRTVFMVTVRSSTKKLYINYFCSTSNLNKNQTALSLCFLEINATNLGSIESPNFMSLKVIYEFNF